MYTSDARTKLGEGYVCRGLSARMINDHIYQRPLFPEHGGFRIGLWRVQRRWGNVAVNELAHSSSRRSGFDISLHPGSIAQQRGHSSAESE